MEQSSLLYCQDTGYIGGNCELEYDDENMIKNSDRCSGHGSQMCDPHYDFPCKCHK